MERSPSLAPRYLLPLSTDAEMLELRAALGALPTDSAAGDKRVDFDDAMDLVVRAFHARAAAALDRLRTAFVAGDADGSGTLNWSEFARVMGGVCDVPSDTLERASGGGAGKDVLALYREVRHEG